MKYVHSDIKNKNIQSIYELSASFDLFAEEEGGIDGDTLWARIVEAILGRHGEAQEITRLDHPRSIWRLDIEDFYFCYQVLSTVIEVGDIVANRTGSSFEPTQDLLAEFTAEEAA
jgi:hypothetical protein